MSVEPFKYLLQPVALERDEETGRVLREIPGQPVTVFSAEACMEAAELFERGLAEAQNGVSNTAPGARA
jgi:hypothetical protein